MFPTVEPCIKLILETRNRTGACSVHATHQLGTAQYENKEGIKTLGGSNEHPFGGSVPKY